MKDNSKRQSFPVRAYAEERERLNRLAREISAIQNKPVRTPEVIRRMMNVPTLPEILKKDAENKRRMGR